MTRRIPILGIAVLSALMLVAAGCGGGSSESAAESDGATTTETTATATETTSTEHGSTSFASTENCRQLADLGVKLSQALGATGASADTETTAKFLTEFADKTPKAIRADFRLIASTYAEIADALKGINVKAGETPSAEALQKLQTLSTTIDQAKVTAASTRISVWVQTNCTQTG